MRFVRTMVAVALCAGLAAPAAAQGTTGGAIARLEAARARNPQNVAALRALGVAYYKAQRWADARSVLDRARQLDPKDGVSALYAGMAAEQQGDLTAARNAYETYLKVGTTRRAKERIRVRLVSLARAEAVASAKAAVANEATLSRTPGAPLTVAVPPLRFRGVDTSLAVLERGMADLIITDLGQVARLTVVERDRMQALADEIRLAQSDRVDSTSAVRAGRLMQAGTLVNGVIVQPEANRLTLDASLVNVASGAIGAPATVNNTIDQLFDMEKRLVFQLLDRLNVQLTPAERQAIERRPTTNLQAFLSYSRGLQAADDGRFADAARFFEQARSLDPGFSAAAARGQAAQAAAQGTEVTPAIIEASLGTGTEGQVAEAASRGSPVAESGGLQNTLRTITQQTSLPTTGGDLTTTSTTSTQRQAPERDPSTSTPGTDAIVRTGQVIIIIRRP